MAYTDSTQVSNLLQRSLTSYETSALPNLILAVQKWLDNRLNSTFDQVAPSVRYYDGGVRNLDIDPCTAITQIEAINDDGTDSYIYTQPYEIVVEPQNENVKREIRKRLAAFPRGIHRIAVSAMFSEYDGGVPADIQIAATRLVAGLINAGKLANVAGTGVQAESLEGHSVTYNDGITRQGTAIEGLAVSDPTVSSIIQNRQELYVDNYNPQNELGSGDDDNGGLMI